LRQKKTPAEARALFEKDLGECCLEPIQILSEGTEPLRYRLVATLAPYIVCDARGSCLTALSQRVDTREDSLSIKLDSHDTVIWVNNRGTK